MKFKSIVFAFLFVVLAFAFVNSADAGLFYPRYWGLDARTVWNYSTAWTTIRTGYWGGSYSYYYGGYSWMPNYGWYYPYNSYYSSYYGSSWGWGAPSWYYGFTDYYTYRTVYAWPRTIYTWSRYWDPDGTGYTMDFYTEVSAEEKALAIDNSIINGIEIGTHNWSYNGGEQSGAFTDLQWIIASPDAMSAYLAAQGFDLATISDILGEQILLDAFASNFNSLTGGYGDLVIGVQWCDYIIPEPATLFLLTTGLFLIRRKK
jgi:hypothetical protein